MASRIAIAMSGGVDSMISAYLLKQTCRDMVGIHFVTGFENEDAPPGLDGVPEPLARAAKELDLPIEVVNLQEEFQTRVVAPFVDTYLKGRTPNPCMVCNRTVKFGALLDAARNRFNAEKIATGHYARVRRDSAGRFRLVKGADPKKDQSYFLGLLSQAQLGAAVFPLGEFTKEQIRDKAIELGLDQYTKPESQETCFIADDRYRKFLQNQPGFQSRPGDVVNVRGEVIGRHQGVFAFTIGQRRGINIPASEAYYVQAIDPGANRITVCFKSGLLSRGVHVTGVNWIIPPRENAFKAAVRIRYRHKEAASAIEILEDESVNVWFDQPQSAVTPGQGAVFYQEDEVLGAGWIDKPLNP
ncbi:tRNA-specific 2-thiouridylase [Desulfatibacillum alkenivorans DSM 16219]|uniref:tRNA-specific 2-thiouridylase MnmA n=1 Tax=Desulfatibacillum alkenivorans DSM 16219 TaxID=1121393 RepID=A0A1M6WFK8_9BACT|nr:tRNA 2-thiouridine(34) synthase MnmA [Desulfatibacillum alkenivorans]SHK92497.1 tRNA-specific 2-thiouridylase [Desulfatibacillum alkenivorans DSM 16219]